MTATVVLGPAATREEWLAARRLGVTDTDGISRSAALKICGNGVVPQQAVLALDLLGVQS